MWADGTFGRAAAFGRTGGFAMANRDAHDWMWGEALSMLARAERLQQQVFQPTTGSARRPVWAPPVDVLETPREVTIIAALPGVGEEAVELRLDGAFLVIAGERVLPEAFRSAAIHRIELPQPVVVADRIEGEVVRVDHFGNLVTNIRRKVFDTLAGGAIEIRVAGHEVPRVVSTYADAAPGEVCALFGSTDHLEIAASGASAAAALDLKRGAIVQVARRA